MRCRSFIRRNIVDFLLKIWYNYFKEGGDGMAIIEKEDYVFDVDIDKTREYYATRTLCDCNECQNFYRQAESTFPKLKDYLSHFGIDISRPDEICSTYHWGEDRYFAVSYTAVGECVKCGEYEIDIEDGGTVISLVINKDPVFPHEQEEGRCFEIVLYNVRLPWVLEEPHEEEKAKVGIWTRIKRLFIKENK